MSTQLVYIKVFSLYYNYTKSELIGILIVHKLNTCSSIFSTLWSIVSVRAGFTHRHSRHVPMLIRPGGGANKMKRYIIFLLYYGLSIYNSKRTKTPEYIEQINITNNRIKNDTFISMFSTFFMYRNHALFLPFSLTDAHTVQTHSRTHAET